MACLAGVVVVVAYDMSEWRTFLSIDKTIEIDTGRSSDHVLLTVIFDLTIAIGGGLVAGRVCFHQAHHGKH